MRDIVEASKETLPKVLIADDDPAVVSLLADRCVKMGFVETAANGIQLLIKARHSHPDLMIVDVNMPELDGFSACTRLLEPGSRPFDVIVIAGNPNSETVERCESLGLFYGCKGFEFWKSIEAALVEIFPDMKDKIVGLETESKNTTLQERARVLLIDDDPAIQQFLASRLRKYGIDTLYASDAAHGYRIACKSRPSVVVTDNYMPNGDAQYLLSRLRRTPATGNTPVIVISGQRLDTITKQNLTREIGGQPGAAHIFQKSLETDELFEALQKYCSFDKH